MEWMSIHYKNPDGSNWPKVSGNVTAGADHKEATHLSKPSYLNQASPAMAPAILLPVTLPVFLWQ